MARDRQKALLLGLTDHFEGPTDRPFREILVEVSAYIREADSLGVEFAWFAEHHAHIHEGHLPSPLLFALHLAGQTKNIRLGTAVICLNLHHPLSVAEQAAVADELSGNRMAIGFGSGSSPEEFGLFGLDITDECERHARFSEAMEIIRAAWSGTSGFNSKRFTVNDHTSYPRPAESLFGRCWQAVNSVGSAEIAGRFGLNMLFSHLRTPGQYREYRAAYLEAGGRGMIAANRPVFVAESDELAAQIIEEPLRALWRRFKSEGKISAETPESSTLQTLAAHPINFIFGGPATVARQIQELRDYVDFDVLNAELRWDGLSPANVEASLSLLAVDVRAMLDEA